ncbi:uncharacterized protein I303_107622 [Kwoniella dejecticola CBS 10117]|uniref:ATP-dependent DNA helicase n=1 Tax=Kwoniella dejecticola CBS 10117 TaxID=1296121 RepID=A0A1A5ZV95_9TREE|nr:uncharacterized protein I303_07633 [Kwoniella dejecticola CBS 10117]OBR81723.1 hypothetical protein I303_07633 [Kwoniella dejecticola CBS 10117]
MSDDDFGDDSFFVDDSFLREVDNLTSQASASTTGKTTTNTTAKTLNNGFTRSVSLQNPKPISNPAHSSKGWTGVQRSVSGPSKPTKPLTKINSTPAFSLKAVSQARKSSQHSSQKDLDTGRNIPPRPKSKSNSQQLVYSSEDELDILPLEPESIAALDSLTNPPRAHSSSATRPISAPKNNGQPSSNPAIPSSRIGLGRPNNSSNPSSSRSFERTNSSSGFLQTHLNFRKERQTTKGKIWDRTEFAETGRRIGADKVKNKSKSKNKGKRKSRDWEDECDEGDEEEDEDEDDWGAALAPPPKPLVDMNAPYEPQRHVPNSATIGTYIYPTNKPKRDYQYEIIRACFRDNCLVALPTGLGKTFVAGVVMLNFYRWFPTGKIVFLAPTKPLVNQQIEACQLSCGIPSKDAAVMTGSSVSGKERARLWEDRRVFYCTPQTLDNDLKKGSVDPRDIVLAVFDEAHKASGSYAYTTILAYITAHHPFFRVLALTATPGADVPKVQNVVDALHISRIEIREAEAPEIRKYMNEKRTEKHVVPMGDIIESFRDRWAAIMKPNVAKLVDKDILTERDLDVKRLRPFRLTAKRMEIAKDRNSGLKWAFGSLTALEKMARAMGHLLEFSLGMFHTTLVEIAGGTNAQGKKSASKGSSNSVRNNTEFQKLLRDVEVEMNMIRIGKDGRSKADKHPKMQKTLELLLAHFTQAEEEEKTLGQKNDTRAMVFCSFRECVLDIVDMLNQHSGLLRATKFVGQSQGKQEEDQGFNQKEQKKTINEFKDGKYNILVSTSIGEEGLDIGEVDFVIIYDMPKQSIKLLQRIGRTGRKRDGKVHVLMSENREDMNWETAQQTHRDIQEEILHSRNLELFEDVEPLLPDKFPECIEQEMEIDPWDPENKEFQKTLAEAERLVRKEKAKQQKALNQSSKAKTSTKGSGKGKDKATRGHEIPDDAQGFKSVAELLRGAGKLPSKGGYNSEEEAEDVGSKRKSTKKRGRAPSPVRSESDDEHEDQDLDSVFADTGSRGMKSTKAKKTMTKRARKSEEKVNKIVARMKTDGISLADIDLNISESDDDREPEAVQEQKQPKQPAKKSNPTSRNSYGSPAIEDIQETERGTQQSKMGVSALDFFNTVGPVRRGMDRSKSRSRTRSSASPMFTPPSSPPPLLPNHHPKEPATSPDGHKATGILDDSPGTNIDRRTQNGTTYQGQKLTPRTAAAAGFSQIAPVDLDLSSWDMDADLDLDDELISPVLRKTHDRQQQQQQTPGSMLPPPIPSSVIKVNSDSSPFHPSTTKRSSNRASVSSNTPIPATQFPVRRLGMRRPRPIVLSSGGRDDNSPVHHQHPQSPVESSPLVLDQNARRRVIVQSSSPIVERTRPRQRARAGPNSDRNGHGRAQRGDRKKKKKGPIGDYMDMDAQLSGSDSGDSSEHSASSVETESDRRFANDFQPTQAPKGYNQQAIYLAGLGTQARGFGLNFKRDFGDARKEFLGKARKAVYITDDEDEDDDEGELHLRGSRGRRRAEVEPSSENEYELGSFVVNDSDDE